MFETAAPLAILLAQTCVAEVGFNKDPSECILMWEVNERNAKLRNRSLRKQTLLYNAYWRSTPQRNRRPWIQHLKGGEEPKLWNKRLKWKVHRGMWLRYVRTAREFLNSHKRRIALCPGALDYGAPKEYPAHYMERITCLTKTKQWYWARKSDEDIRKSRKGILPKKALAQKNIIRESIMTQKKRAERTERESGVND